MIFNTAAYYFFFLFPSAILYRNIRASLRPWVIALCDIIADNAELLVKGQDATFQNKVHLAMQAKGFSDSKEQAPND